MLWSLRSSSESRGVRCWGSVDGAKRHRRRSCAHCTGAGLGAGETAVCVEYPRRVRPGHWAVAPPLGDSVAAAVLRDPAKVNAACSGFSPARFPTQIRTADVTGACLRLVQDSEAFRCRVPISDHQCNVVWVSLVDATKGGTFGAWSPSCFWEEQSLRPGCTWSGR